MLIFEEGVREFLRSVVDVIVCSRKRFLRLHYYSITVLSNFFFFFFWPTDLYTDLVLCLTTSKQLLYYRWLGGYRSVNHSPGQGILRILSPWHFTPYFCKFGIHVLWVLIDLWITSLPKYMYTQNSNPNVNPHKVLNDGVQTSHIVGVVAEFTDFIFDINSERNA